MFEIGTVVISTTQITIFKYVTITMLQQYKICLIAKYSLMKNQMLKMCIVGNVLAHRFRNHLRESAPHMQNAH